MIFNRFTSDEGYFKLQERIQEHVFPERKYEMPCAEDQLRHITMTDRRQLLWWQFDQPQPNGALFSIDGVLEPVE